MTSILKTTKRRSNDDYWCDSSVETTSTSAGETEEEESDVAVPKRVTFTNHKDDWSHQLPTQIPVYSNNLPDPIIVLQDGCHLEEEDDDPWATTKWFLGMMGFIFCLVSLFAICYVWFVKPYAKVNYIKEFEENDALQIGYT